MIIIIICLAVLIVLPTSDLRPECNNVTFLPSRFLGIIIRMSIIEIKSILIIKAPAHNMRPVEHFLQKRNFKVFIEHDVKMAMLKLVEVQPSIIFLAWDHPNLKIMDLPAQMAQATNATIIPYVMGFTREDVRKLDACALNPKLYPPVSGPAIERLISKFVKIQIRKNSDYDEIVSGYKTEKGPAATAAAPVVATPPKKPAAPAEQELVTETNPIPKSNIIVIKQQKRQEILLTYKKKTLSPGFTAELEKTFPTQVKIPIEKLLLDDKNSRPQQKTNSTAVYRAYCLAVVSEAWCGYLTTISNYAIETGPLRKIVAEWIKENFENVIEPDEHDFVEITNLDPEWMGQLKKSAEYYEQLEIKDFDIRVCFFSFEPAKMNVEINDENSLIQMSTQDVPSDEELPFSLHLHLPENKKYIVYTQANKVLTGVQKDRLIANKILLLYTPINFEREYKKFLTAKNIKSLWLNPLKKKSAV